MDLEAFYYPRSIVVFGVSDSPGNLGRDIIRNLNRFGFEGPVYGLGRKAMEIEGRKVYTGLEDMPETPDLAVLLVPASAVADALQACGKRGVRHAVIETAGFSEFGTDRKGLEDAIRDTASAWNITFLGPNCIGTVNAENHLCLPFVPFDPEEIRPGRNSLISQSGGIVHEVIRRCAADNVGLNKLTSVGNKLAVDESDVLEFLIRDAGTGAIGLYLEDIKNGRRLMDLASSTEKPVIVLKGNASPAAREIASFHTAALVGDEAVTAAALRQAGIHQVLSLQEMVELFKIFDLPPMKGTKVAVISRSGGQSVLLADDAYRHGFSLARLSPGLFDLIATRSKGGVIKRTNPVDLGDVFDELFYLEVLGEVLKEEDVDGVAFFFDYEINPSAVLDMVKGAERLSREHEKPVLLCLVPDRAHWFLTRDVTPFPFFSHPTWAFDGLSRSLAHFRRKAVKGRGTSFSALLSERKVPDRERRTERSGESHSHRLASMPATLALAEEYGIPIVDYALLRSGAEALNAANAIGYPVALKRAEPLVLHKTEAKAVRLDIPGDRELKEALEAMQGDLYLLQKMAPAGVETIIGGKRDPEFGPVVVFGLGGIFVEALGDVTMRVAPVDSATARDMIGEIRGRALLEGARGAKPADVESLSRAIAAVSRMLADHPEIETLDINPLRVFEEGKGCMALDIKIGVVE
jgi:acetate---CoA ligase (ADP-forming)